MKTLSGLDASFLYLESPETPMHVGSLHLYRLPPGFRGSFRKVVQRHIAERLHLVPLLRQRLAFMPLDLGHPGWVNAEEVDLDHHIRSATVRGTSGPLSLQQLQEAVAALHARRLDRKRPLWEFHIFEQVQPPPGLDGTGRVIAFYSKIHHAALDGKAGTVLANAILDLGPTPRAVPPPDAQRLRRRQVGDPGTAEMVISVLTNSLVQYARIVKALPGTAKALGSTVADRVFQSGDKGTDWLHPRLPLSLAPKTRFNTALTRRRSLATLSLPFDECHRLAHAMGGSVNDLMLWLCATALREYLAARRDALPRRSLVAAMPVSLREEGNEQLNTQASMVLVDLGTQHADPLRRMQAILASTAKVKDALAHYKSLVPTDYPSLLAPWLVSGVAKAAYKVYSATGLDQRLPMLANLVISNVPGPRVPLYLAGARMMTYYPLSIVQHGLALNITLQTYAGSVDFGLVADRKAAPHLQELADGIEAAFALAQQLTREPPREVAKVTKTRTRSPKTGSAPLKSAGGGANVKGVATRRSGPTPP